MLPYLRDYSFRLLFASAFHKAIPDPTSAEPEVMHLLPGAAHALAQLGACFVAYFDRSSVKQCRFRGLLAKGFIKLLGSRSVWRLAPLFHQKTIVTLREDSESTRPRNPLDRHPLLPDSGRPALNWTLTCLARRLLQATPRKLFAGLFASLLPSFLEKHHEQHHFK